MENFDEAINRISETCIEVLESTIEKTKEIKNLKCKGCQLINLIALESGISFFMDSMIQIQSSLAMVSPFIHKIVEDMEEGSDFKNLRKMFKGKDLEEIEKLEKLFNMKSKDK